MLYIIIFTMKTKCSLLIYNKAIVGMPYMLVLNAIHNYVASKS